MIDGLGTVENHPEMIKELSGPWSVRGEFFVWDLMEG
jgi:hypothetical protein